MPLPPLPPGSPKPPSPPLTSPPLTTTVPVFLMPAPPSPSVPPLPPKMMPPSRVTVPSPLFSMPGAPGSPAPPLPPMIEPLSGSEESLMVKFPPPTWIAGLPSGPMIVWPFRSMITSSSMISELSVRYTSATSLTVPVGDSTAAPPKASSSFCTDVLPVPQPPGGVTTPVPLCSSV